LRYPPPLSLPYGFFGGLAEYTEYTLPDHAIPGDTPRVQPQGPFVVPGKYTVELTVDGETYRQSLIVKLDPRVHTSIADLQTQLQLEQRICRGMAASYNAYQRAASLRKELEKRRTELESAEKRKQLKEQVDALEKKIDAVENGLKTAPGFGPVNRDLTRLVSAAGSADARPSETIRAAVEENCNALTDDLRKWSELNAKDLPAFNSSILQPYKISPLPVAGNETSKGCGQ
jgi:hypothetical protein